MAADRLVVVAGQLRVSSQVARPGCTDRAVVLRITNGIDANVTHVFGYDVLDRLTDTAIPGGAVSYQYDAVGNRTAHIHNGQMTPYGIAPDSNRTQWMGGKPRTFDSNANGNVVRWNGADGEVPFDAFQDG